MSLAYCLKNGKCRSFNKRLSMSKARKYGIGSAIAGALVKGGGNAIKQWQQMARTPGVPFDWQVLLKESAQGAAAFGVIGLGIGLYKDYRNSQIEPINTDAALYSTLLRVKLNHEGKDYAVLREKGKIIVALFQRRFKDLLQCDPVFMGSTERGTAVRRKFDLDIGMLFRHDSFNSTAEMYRAVLDYAHNLIGLNSIVEVWEQKKSIGIICGVGGKELKIDLVPCKLTKGSGRAGSGYLFVNKQSWWGNRSTYTKTDIHLLNNQKLTHTQKNLVVLLKEWKNQKNVPLPSHLLENLVLNAYQYNWGRIPPTLTKKMIMIYDFIAENLNGIVIRSVENTNNILTDISDEDKQAIVASCNSALDNFRYQKNSIIDTIRQRG